MDYSNYTYQELIEAYHSIDNDKYPDTYAKLLHAIEDAEKDLCETEKIDLSAVRQPITISRFSPRNKTEFIRLLTVLMILGGLLYAGFIRVRSGDVVLLSENPVQFSVLFLIIAGMLLYGYLRDK